MGGGDYHYYGKGNSFGQQRKLGDFVFAPTLSGNDHLRTGDIVTGGGDYHYYGKGNTFGQQRKLGDFVFAPTLSGNDHLRTGNIVTGGKIITTMAKGTRLVSSASSGISSLLQH